MRRALVLDVVGLTPRLMESHAPNLRALARQGAARPLAPALLAPDNGDRGAYFGATGEGVMDGRPPPTMTTRGARIETRPRRSATLTQFSRDTRAAPGLAGELLLMRARLDQRAPRFRKRLERLVGRDCRG